MLSLILKIIFLRIDNDSLDLFKFFDSKFLIKFELLLDLLISELLVLFKSTWFAAFFQHKFGQFLLKFSFFWFYYKQPKKQFLNYQKEQ